MAIFTPQQFLARQSDLDAPERLERLVEVLRGPQGCPWDQRQTALSILEFVIDEAHELKQALQREDIEEITSEFGDLAFTVTFLGQTLAPQVQREEAVSAVVKKMVARHPHVFAREDSDDPVSEADVKRRWESLKSTEKPAQSNRRMDRDLPASLPAWKKASKILSRARNAGFRYPNAQEAWNKVAEEWGELCQALEKPEGSSLQDELGDLLLALAAAAMEEGIDAEQALLEAARKLCDRLETMETLAGKAISEIPKAELAGWYAKARAPKATVCFNYCGVSLWPGPVRQAVARAAAKLASDGLSATLELRQEREGLRQRLGELVDADPASAVIFLPNVSAGALGVAYCMDWNPGDRVLLGRQEFPANSVPWKMAGSTFALKVLEFDEDLLRTDPAAGWAQLEEILGQERPRLLALSAVSFWSGFRLDTERLAQLAHRYGARLFVDAVQALGTVPLSMGSIDFLAGGSHKGMLSPEGAGFLLVSPRVKPHWVPRLGSWLSLPEPFDFLVTGDPSLNPNQRQPRPGDPTTLEGSSPNTLGYAALDAAVKFLLQADPKAIFTHIQALQDPIDRAMTAWGWNSLRSEDPQGRSAILSYDPPPGLDLVALASRLAAHGVQAGIPRGRLRFGLHLMTTQSDVERLLEVMKNAQG